MSDEKLSKEIRPGKPVPWLGDRIYVPELESWACVLSIHHGFKGTTYEVAWFHDGRRESAYLHDSEFRLTKEASPANDLEGSDEEISEMLDRCMKEWQADVESACTALRQEVLACKNKLEQDALADLSNKAESVIDLLNGGSKRREARLRQREESDHRYQQSLKGIRAYVEDRKQRCKSAVADLRKCCFCLNLEVDPSIADDVKKHAEMVIALLDEMPPASFDQLAFAASQPSDVIQGG